MQIITTERIPIKMWLDDIEDGALEQAKNIANLPFAFKHIAIMPDSHQGYGMPIGGVLATKYVIIPNAVGVDIGCGMCAVRTTLEDIDVSTLKKIMGRIREVVPVGFNKHAEAQSEDLMPLYDLWQDAKDDMRTDTKNLKDWIKNFYDLPVIYKEYKNALKSLGTLGGGNHFIEIQKGSDGYIWIMIHSGSRNLGLKVANHYKNLAKELNKKYYSEVNLKQDLAFLPIDSDEGKAYLREMKYCVEYALVNRKLMMERIKEIFHEETLGDARFEEMINIAHNYASLESHFGENVWIHRKGATLARNGTIGIIPGSQGTKSYIVEGKGNKNSFESCSHGAGRTMSRNEAIRSLDLEAEIKMLDDKGIIHGIRTEKDLDEAASAYKDIDVVMENQKDLVNIKVELTPIAGIKG